LSVEKLQRTGFELRDQRGVKKALKAKKPSPPANRRIKAFGESSPARAEQAGLILLFDGEVGCRHGRGVPPIRHQENPGKARIDEPRNPAQNSHDEHRQTDILTSGLKPRSRLPELRQVQWHWEFVARYSGATVPDFHGVPGRLATTNKMDA